MFDAHGAALYPGRWNAPGQPVIYASEHYSTALLEKLVHTLRLPPNQHFVEIEISEGVSCREFTTRDLPSGWDSDEQSIARALGADWLREGRSAVLLVPSAVAPVDRNVLINLDHPDAKGIVPGPETPVPWDHRLSGRCADDMRVSTCVCAEVLRPRLYRRCPWFFDGRRLPP